MKRMIIVLAGALFASLASAQDYTAGKIAIVHPAARAMVPGAKVGGGYLAITNTGTDADRLVSSSADRARSVQLHEMRVDDGVMVMRELKGGIELPAGQTVELKPGGYHLMFMDVDKPFKQGETIKATLTFEKAGSVDVDFAVGAAAGPLNAGGHDNHDAMPGMDMGDATTQEDEQAIPAGLKTMFETPDKPLTVMPVVVEGDWAIAGWQQDGRGGRALLKKGQAGWSVHLCSGDSLRDAAALEKIGLSKDAATGLAAKLKQAETGLDPRVLALFATFEGTVVMDAAANDVGHSGHEGHAQ
ncbi:copper uptake system-associated protein [Rhizobium phaseoli]|uniref:copper uptake system-associated protein n=1 Tax=Rhizobium phaseoli TaxID=396 RepID=UPI000BE98550|nr:copper uptake system-associated protein [Rhizobium phaseoli]PDS31582.1 hypothetical protein CO650_10370 [Rhizobium phaseoli]